MNATFAYVTLFTWDWKPIGQVKMGLSHLYHDGKLDRSELDDEAQKAARPLLEGKTEHEDVHVLIHTGDYMPPEQLVKSAKRENERKGPDAVSWGRNRRLRRPDPIDPEVIDPEVIDFK